MTGITGFNFPGVFVLSSDVLHIFVHVGFHCDAKRYAFVLVASVHVIFVTCGYFKFAWSTTSRAYTLALCLSYERCLIGFNFRFDDLKMITV